MKALIQLFAQTNQKERTAEQVGSYIAFDDSLYIQFVLEDFCDWLDLCLQLGTANCALIFIQLDPGSKRLVDWIFRTTVRSLQNNILFSRTKWNDFEIVESTNESKEFMFLLRHYQISYFSKQVNAKNDLADIEPIKEFQEISNIIQLMNENNLCSNWTRPDEICRQMSKNLSNSNCFVVLACFAWSWL